MFASHLMNMCGIIGYVGEGDANSVVVRGLKGLTYRGYDSCGIAVLSNGTLTIKKDIGKIEDVDAKLNFSEPRGKIAIGHTRWATHGGVSPVNSHPHSDCTGTIAIVHNGIIENYNELKRRLEARGHKFKSQTDSEVIAHLIEELDSGSFWDACKKAFSLLRGSFAVLAIKAGEDVIVGVRKDSPLVIGIGKDENFVASDIYAILPFTKNVIFLQNYDMLLLRADGLKIENLKHGSVEPRIETLDVQRAEADKKNFHHFMIKEIMEQAEAFERAFKQDSSKIEKIVEAIKKAKSVVLLAAGTSYHACLAANYFFSRAKVFSKAVVASEFDNFLDLVDRDTLIIAASQSGETADVLHAIRKAKERGAMVVSIVNVYGSSLARESDESLMMNAGPEVGVAATKTYITELAIFLLLYSRLTCKEFIVDEIKAKILDLLSRSRREYIERVAEKLKDKNHVFLIGRGLGFITALEAALKIKEISYIHAEAFPGGEIKHGTIALIENGTPCIVFVGRENKDDVLANAHELRARGGFIVGVAEENSKIFDLWIKVPEDGEASLIYQIIPMQLLAYMLAVMRGCDPDHPRSLAKSVTVK